MRLPSEKDFAERFRPQIWDEVIGQENAIKTLRATLEHNHIARAYLLEGPMGTGKTSLARVYSRALTCLNRTEGVDQACGECASCEIDVIEHPDIRIIDSTNLGGVNDIREHILGSAYYQPILGQYRVYIIDEAHGLTGASANALLSMVEDHLSGLSFSFARPKRAE